MYLIHYKELTRISQIFQEMGYTGCLCVFKNHSSHLSMIQTTLKALLYYKEPNHKNHLSFLNQYKDVSIQPLNLKG